MNTTFKDGVQRSLTMDNIKSLCQEVGILYEEEDLTIFVHEDFKENATEVGFILYGEKKKGKINVVFFRTMDNELRRIAEIGGLSCFWAVKSGSKFAFSLGENNSIFNKND